MGHPGPNEKRCPGCESFKPFDAFPRNRATRDGIAVYCKPCHNARAKESRERLHGGSRHYHLVRRYGVTAEQVDALIAQQQGLCAICGEGPAEHVDHDHATGAVRGIRCFRCNAGLGSFRDNPEWLGKAIEYLGRPPRIVPERDGKVAQEKKRQGRSYRGVREAAPSYGRGGLCGRESRRTAMRGPLR